MVTPTPTASRSTRPITVADLERVIAIDRVHSGHSRRHFFEKRFAAAKARPSEWVLVPGGWHMTQMKEQRAPTAAADPGNGRKTETELEELAGQLYGRISRRLRRELLVDRERAGLMVDLP